MIVEYLPPQFVQNLPALIIAIPLFGAFIAPLLKKHSRAAAGWTVAITGVAFLLSILLMDYVRATQAGMVVYVFGADNPGLTLPSGYSVPIRIMFQIDGLGVLMAFLCTLLPFLAAIYSVGFSRKETGLEKYYTLMMLMTVGMLGMVLTGDIFNLFVFLEINSIAGAALVGFRNYRGEAAEAGFKYIAISAFGALMVLFSIGILYGKYGNLNIAYLSGVIEYSRLDLIALGLLLTTFALKCGTAPMHHWVPDAYGEAPGSISMMMVISSLSSLYALIRVCFILFGAIVISLPVIGWILIVLGLISMLLGATMSLIQNDIKRFIGYQAVSQTGYMVMAIGVGLAVMGDPVAMQAYGRNALVAGVFHLINDAIYMGLLFLAASAVIYAARTRNMDEMGGLARKMPYTAVFFMIGAASIGGLPPFSGFASKLLIYESVFAFNPLLAIVAMVTSIIALAAFAKQFAAVFLGPPLSNLRRIREAPMSMLIAMGVVAFLTVLFGLYPQIVIEWLVKPAVGAMLNLAGYGSWGGA